MTLKHAAIFVADLKRSLRFYNQVLRSVDYHSGDPDWAMVRWHDTSLSFLRTDAPRFARKDRGHSAHLGLCLSSPDKVDTEHARIRREFPEVTVGTPVRHRDGSYGFYLMDPDRNQIEMIFIPVRSHMYPVALGEEATVAAVWAVAGSDSLSPVWERWQSRIAHHVPKLRSRLAFLDGRNPSLLEAVNEILSEQACRKIRIVPMAFTEDTIATKMLPHQIEALALANPGVVFEQTVSLGSHSAVQEAWVEAAVDLAWPSTANHRTTSSES